MAFDFQLAQYQSVKYEMYPLSPVSRHRLSEYLLSFFIANINTIYRTSFDRRTYHKYVNIIICPLPIQRY